MSGEIHIGDNIYQTGSASIGKIQHQAPVDSLSALREMITLAMDLRAHVSAFDGQAIEESVRVVQQGKSADRGALRRALTNLIGVATMAGAVGGPVLDAAMKVKEIFGL